jgi:UDP-N-acetylglucosamine 4,6-dehydratase/5-epimerase
MKNVLVTGGSGFVGRSLIRELLLHYPDIEITSLSRSEGVISQLLMECPDKRLNITIADLRDAQAVNQALRHKDTVIHLAAMKRVDLCEAECHEAASINVIGTMNVLDAFQGETFIMMSTDKAVEPCNCYGATKLVGERLVIERAKKADNGNRFMIVRSGNIMGSTGSVLDIWKSQIEKHNEITVTNLEMLRFYTSIEGVVKLYLAVLDRGENGKLYFTPQGEPIVLKEFAEKALKLYGNDQTKIKYVGLRLGERMVERMRTPDEVNTIAGFEEQYDELAPPKAVTSKV